ncbi:MAG: YkvA family protein [Xanthomonadales bacterium]|jgi:uncharacterized membrane protein YkvA (DUF1232 family)|nr:YkvA family protein [Xanthomonadales bacterium]
MSMEITVKLSAEDLEHFRSAMRDTYNAKSDLDDETIINHARETITKIRQSDAPEYIQERIGSLEALIGLLTDPNWKMAPQERPRVLETLAYFAETNDIIPDEIPGLGYLDDAFMIDIVCQDFEDELEAYRDFCVYRVTEAQHRGRDVSETEGAEWLEHRLRQLHLRKHLSRKEGKG